MKSQAINIETLVRDEETSNPWAGRHKGVRLYVITVNYDSEPQMRRLVESLSLGGFVEKLIVVNHSPDYQLEGMQAEFPIQVIHQPNRGYGAGLNRGLQEVRDDEGLILLCNPDIVVLNHEAIDDVWRYMIDNPNVGLVVPALVDAQMRPIRSCRKFYSLLSLLLVSNPYLRKLMPTFCSEHYYMQRPEGIPLEVDWGSGSAIFVRGDVANNGPLFDERFFLYFEDVDLCARMWGDDRQVVYFPDLVFQHFESRLSHKKIRYFMIHMASLLKFILKHKGLPQRSTFLAQAGMLQACEPVLHDLPSPEPENGPVGNWVQAQRRNLPRG